MLRFVFYVVLGYIVLRVLSFLFRPSINASGQRGPRRTQNAAQTQTPEQTQFDDIRDAEFEDVTNKEPSPTTPDK